MSGEEWLRIVNQLAEKTKAGKLAWTPAEGGKRAAVRDDFAVHLAYTAIQVKQQVRPADGSLTLTLLNQLDEKLAVLGETAMNELAGAAVVFALRGLFDAVVAAPRAQSLEAFRDALTEL